MDLRAMQDVFDRVSKKQKVAYSNTREIIDKLREQLEQAIENAVNGREIDADQQTLFSDLQSQLTQYGHLNQLGLAQKDLNMALSKYGKVMDKQYSVDIAKAYREMEFNSHLINQVIALHFYRQGLFELGDCFVDDSQEPNAASFKAPFYEMFQILEAMKSKNLEPALEWARLHQNELNEKGSSLEFKLHQLQFVHVFLKSGRSAALQYARSSFGQFSSQHMGDIQRLMGCLLWAGKLESSPYADLLSSTQWEAASLEFTRECCSLLGQAYESPLQAGRLFDSSHNNKSKSRISEKASLEYYESSDMPLLVEQEMQVIPSTKRTLGYVTGLVAQAKVSSFERYLFRATRGNMLFKQEAIDDFVVDPTTSEKVKKAVFLVFFSGEWAQAKVTRICESFGATCYPFPEEKVVQEQMNSEVASRLDELEATLGAGIRHRKALLTTISYQYEVWRTMVHKEKAIYHCLNMLNVDVTRKCLVAEGWCPVASKDQVQEALKCATLSTNSQVGVIFHELETNELPPTYFKTNKFTIGFQEIVDSYGIAKYREVNPGVFTIITFPFLFAVMFGDWGHGLVLLLASLYFILNERKLGSKKLDDITMMAYQGRYVILLMSVFSVYTGFIYNEFFSVSFEIFGASTYKCSNPSCGDASTKGLIKAHHEPYPFGVDPAWRGARSELPFLNSLKMKMSILLGVTHMMLGIIIGFFNAKFFNKPLDIWFQFLPQILFLGALFGYLSLLIVLKWCTGSQADLYHVMIYMFLAPSADLGDNRLLQGQNSIQVFLLFLAVIAVPWMLLPKPLLLRMQHIKKSQGRSYNVLGDSDSVYLDHEDKEDKEFRFGEVFVHQFIHTIEFVLGAVSNTASYLRLWALSLAHAQLSSVFYEKVLLLSWSYESIFIRMLGVIVFMSATVGVLLIMETLSAFLHALRLHWVEFQNKFYEGTGYKFSPFSLSEHEDMK